MSNNNDASSLSRFIHRRLLGNPDIAAEYSHASVPGLFKPGNAFNNVIYCDES